MLVGEDEDNTRSLQRETSEISSLLKEFPKNTNILVVDTSITTLLNMKQIMQQFAYQVKVEADAEKAFAFLTSCEHDINIVVWDFHMPGINGIQALKDIGSKMDLPVVIMSDDSQTESVMEATIHGACDYLMKPVREEVIGNIWQHIVRKRMMSQKMKMMSQPELSPPVHETSDLAQSDGLDKDTTDSKILVDQEQNIDKTEAKRTRETWTEETQLVKVDKVQTNDVVDQQNDGTIIIDQDNSEEEKAAKNPRLSWIEETPLVQSDPVQTYGVGQHCSDCSITIDKDNGGDDKEANMWQKLSWIEETLLVETDPVQTNDVGQHNSDGSITIYKDNGGDDKAPNIMQQESSWIEETQLVQPDPVQTIGFDEDSVSFEFINQDSDETRFQKKEGMRKERKQRMTWNNDLHEKFLEAVELVGGITRASPKSIHQCLQGMKVEGITRYNVASHLQKHRLTIEESHIPSETQQIGLSTARKSTRRKKRSNKASLRNDSNKASLKINDSNNVSLKNDSNNASLRNDSNNVSLRNDPINVSLKNDSNDVQKAAILSSCFRNDQAVNPIQQNQYQNGYLTMNNNQLMTNQLPPLPYVDHRLNQHQQQQYQYQSSSQQQQPYQLSQNYPSSHQHQQQNYHSSYQHQQEQQKYHFSHPHQQQQYHSSYQHQQPQYHSSYQHQQPQQQFQASHQQQYQQQQYQHQQQQYHPSHQQQPYQTYQQQQQQYQSSPQFNYLMRNEEPVQASGIGVTGLELASGIGVTGLEQASGIGVTGLGLASGSGVTGRGNLASGIGVTGLEHTYPSVAYDPLQQIMRGYSINQ